MQCQKATVTNRLPKYKYGSTTISKPTHKLHRIFFRAKTNFLTSDLESKIDLKKIELVHATNLFSDGAIAYKIYKKYNIPYITAIRSTDINAFFNLRPDLLSYGRKIMLNSRKIIFISESLKRKFLAHKAVQPVKKEIIDKCEVILNGINDIFLDNIFPKKTSKPKKVLFVGKFNTNKKALALVKAVIALNRKKNDACQLTLIGGGGSDESQILELSKVNPNSITFLGSITDKNELIEIYRNHDVFAMPSISETFGLVYIEALSQGLPLIYTENDGIDGVFPFPVGEGVINPDSEKISNALEYVLTNYECYDLSKIDFDKFRWNTIAKSYLKIYNKSY